MNNLDCDVLTETFDYKNFKKLNNYWKSYHGQFNNNLFNGQGTLFLSNGEKYIGKFHFGVISGEGSFYKNNGEIIAGIWNENKFIGSR